MSRIISIEGHTSDTCTTADRITRGRSDIHASAIHINTAPNAGKSCP